MKLILGTLSLMSAAEALNVAAAATPRPSNPFDEDPPLGRHVRSIRADAYGRDPVEGELVLIDADEIALRRSDPRLGGIVVHFPRLGYDLRQMRRRSSTTNRRAANFHPAAEKLVDESSLFELGNRSYP